MPSLKGQQSFIEVFHCYFSKPENQNNKTKAPCEKFPLVIIAFKREIWRFPLVQRRLTLFIGLYNEFFCFLDKSRRLLKRETIENRSADLSIFEEALLSVRSWGWTTRPPRETRDDSGWTVRRERAERWQGVNLTATLSVFHTSITCTYSI